MLTYLFDIFIEESNIYDAVKKCIAKLIIGNHF